MDVDSVIKCGRQFAVGPSIQYLSQITKATAKGCQLAVKPLALDTDFNQRRALPGLGPPENKLVPAALMLIVCVCRARDAREPPTTANNKNTRQSV